MIVFAPNLEGPLVAIPAGGGAPASVTRLDAGSREYLHGAPAFLPGGERFLYLAKRRERGKDAVMLGSLGPSPSPPAFLFTSPWSAVYAPGGGGGGYLLFARDGNLLAQRFHPKDRRLTGAPQVVAPQIRASEFGTLDLSVSAAGALVYAVDQPKTIRPKWFSREGVNLGEVGDPGGYRAVRFSPDRRRLASVRDSPSDSARSLWCLDLARGVDMKLLGGTEELDDPVWSPDGSSLVFSWDRDGRANLYLLNLARDSEPKALLPAGRDRWPLDWSADGSLLLYAEIDPASKFDVWALPIGGGAPFPLVRGPGKDNEARFSPDGKLVAYQSDESGHVQVYVRALPPETGAWQVSLDHGAEPRWRADGRELYYISGDSALMAVPILGAGSARRPGKPVRLFGSRESRQGIFVWKFEPDADGRRFLVLTPSEQSIATPVHLALHWQSGVR